MVAIICLPLVLLAVPANAQEIPTKPHVVIGDGVWLYATDGSRLFVLPNSYYAEITSLDDYYYYITFNGISGRVKQAEVTTIGYHTTATGTLYDLKVASDYAEFSHIILKQTPDLSSPTVTTIPTNASFTYVGSYPIEDEIWYAVRWEQYYGYVRAVRTNCPTMNISPFVPEEMPTVSTDTSTDAPADTPTIETNSGQLTEASPPDNTLKIILIIGLIIPAVLVIFLIFRPKKA